MRNFVKIFKNVQSGDAIFFRSPVDFNPINWLGWIIRYFTKGEVNHCGIIIKNEENYDIIEATEKGVVQRNLVFRLADYKGKIVIIEKPHFSPVSKIKERLKSEVGFKGYDEIGLVGFYFFKWFKKIGINLRKNTEESSWFCSELVAYAYKFEEPSDYTPVDIINRLTKKGSLIIYSEIDSLPEN